MLDGKPIAYMSKALGVWLSVYEKEYLALLTASDGGRT